MHLCAVKMGSRLALQMVYEHLDALGLEATLMSHVCPLYESVALELARWTDCPWYEASDEPPADG